MMTAKDTIKSTVRKICAIFGQHCENLSNEEISYDEKRAVLNNYRKEFGCKLFVETGTFLGDTIWHFKDDFYKLYSIELSKELATRAMKRFETYNQITIIEGNSAEVLKSLVQQLDERTLFWLDGHYSSEFFHNGEFIKTAKGDLNTPIEKELQIILHSTTDHVILIDDARLFVGKHDYPTVAAIRSTLTKYKKDYSLQVASDIIHLVPKSKFS